MACQLSRTACARLACALVVACLCAPTATAYIFQQVYTGYWTDPSGSGSPAADSFDRFQEPPDTPRDILAQISGSGYQAVSAAGTFGNLGMQGGHDAVGFLTSRVRIQNSEIVNPFGGPRIVRANFIIDGGFMRLAGPVASLHFTLLLDAYIRDSQGSIIGFSAWEAEARLQCENSMSPQLMLYGRDIGIHMTDPFRAEIPPSFQTFEVGVVPGGGSIDLTYVAFFESRAPAFEFSEFQYSDPLNVGGEGEFPTIEFAPVPEPSALCALAAGLLVLRLRRRTGLPLATRHSPLDSRHPCPPTANCQLPTANP